MAPGNWAQPWRSPFFYGGLVGLASGAAAYVLLWFADARQALAVSVAVGTMVYAGKEAAIPLAIFSLGGSPLLVGAGLVWVDLSVSLAIFPWVSAAVAGVAHSRGLLGGIVRSVHRRADRKRPIVDRYGGVGLFLFLIVPFAFNGPPVGMVLGRIVGLRTRVIAAAFVGAITFTTTAWTVVWGVLYQKGLERLPVPPWLPATVAVSIACAVILGTLWAGWQERRAEKAAAARGR